jgi:NADPH-dependent 2,4-dienoyl-CoA reductase/sulfur reductase-like enzyme/rhodanese-related sulfurtransferase
MKIVVVGGVAAGMSAAARARRLSESAQIIVIERTLHVSFANCGLPYHIGGEIEDREALLLQTPGSLAESLNLDVRIGHEVIAIDRNARTVTVSDLVKGRDYVEAWDKLVLCPGAAPIRPPLPGIENPRILTLRNIENMDAIIATLNAGAPRAVVIGAGYIGVEMAENLRHRGMQVDLVEMLDQIMPPLDVEMARDLQYHLEYHGVRVHLGTAASTFADIGKGVEVMLTNGTTLAAEIVIMAVGVRPDTRLALAAGLVIGERGGIRVDAHQRTSDPDIYAAGDAVEVIDTVSNAPTLIPLAGPANRQGRIAADHIFGRASEYRSTQGTAIVKVFEMTGGGTGSNEKSLQRLGVPYRKVYVHPSGHASYYPGTAPMQLKVLFSPHGGRLLGAQVVGYDGVDKRIDVLATALSAGMTIFDLEELELGYAPPYGSAKDPVNMAGFVGSNLLRGDIDFWYAEDYPRCIEGGVIVDVRGAVEYGAWHIPEAINIPLGKLRGRIDEIATASAVFLYCRVGFRSYLAHRVLVQNGFKSVRTLAGGSKTFCSFHRTPLCTGRPGLPFVAHAEEILARSTDPGCAA